MARTYRTTFSFNATGLGSLLRARNVVQSLGGTSWGAFNQASRAASAANKEFAKMAAGMGAGIGFGYLTKNLISANAELQTNRLLFQSMVGDTAKANRMIGMLQDNAAEYGFDLGEVFKSARGLYSGFSAGGRAVDEGDLSNLMKMAETLNMLDTENRGISFAAFSLKEIAQGVGKMDFRSMTNRMEIPFQQSTQQAITKALQAGKTKEALNLLWKGLEEAGVRKNLLDKMSKEGFVQNLNALKSYASRSFLAIGEPLFNRIGNFLRRIKEQLKPLFQPDSNFMRSLNLVGQNLGSNLSKVKPVLLFIVKWLRSPAGRTMFDTIQDGFAMVKDIGSNALQVAGAFFAGFGIHSLEAQNDIRTFITTLHSYIKETFPVLKAFAFAFGKVVRVIFDLVAKNPDLFGTLAAFHLLGGTAIVGGIFRLMRGITGIGAAIGGFSGGTAAAGGSRLINLLHILRSPVSLGGSATRWGTIIGQLRIIASILMLNPITRFGIYGAFLGIGIAIGNFLRSQAPQMNKWLQNFADDALRAVGIVNKLSSKAINQGDQQEIQVSRNQAEALSRFQKGTHTKADVKMLEEMEKRYKSAAARKMMVHQLTQGGEFNNMFGGLNTTKMNLAKNESTWQLLTRMAKMQQQAAFNQANIPVDKRPKTMFGPQLPTDWQRGEMQMADERNRNRFLEKPSPLKREVKVDQKNSHTFNFYMNNVKTFDEATAKKVADTASDVLARNMRNTTGSHLSPVDY